MTDANTGTSEAEPPQFSLGKVYLRDVSLEAPNSPEAFLAGNEWSPKITLQYKLDNRDLSNDQHNVVLTLTITAADDSKTLFLVEVQQGGIFLIHGTDSPKQLDRVLNVRCPRILFPYAREAVDNLVVKAGFPPLMLAPVDFKAAFARKQASGGDI